MRYTLLLLAALLAGCGVADYTPCVDHGMEKPAPRLECVPVVSK